MIPSAWRLPGPARWLREVLSDIDDSRFVLVRLPAPWAASGLVEAVREERPSLWIDDLEADGAVSDAVLAAAETAGSIEEAFERLADSGTVLWIQVSTSLADSEVVDLAEAHRHATEFARAVVIEHHGPWEAAGPAKAPTLATHHLYGVLGPLDVDVLLHGQEPPLSPTRRSEIVELAGYDLQLAVELAEQVDADHAVLGATCRARAATLGLPGEQPTLPRPRQIPRREPRSMEGLWQQGGVDLCAEAEQPVLHAGLATSDELDRRLWRAQVRVILPFLDEMRLRLIDETRRRGVFVQPGRGDYVELIDLVKVLERKDPAGAITDAAQHLLRARNDLAHLRLVSPQQRRRLREAIRRARLSDALPF